MNLLGLALICSLVDFEEPNNEFYHDFRTNKALPKAIFRLTGPMAGTRIKPEPEGLRITLPVEQEKPGPVGVKTRFQISGDFDITIAYEIIHADQPKSDWGVGFEIHLMTNTATKEAASFFRAVQVSGNDVYLGVRRRTNNTGARENVPGVWFDPIPAISKSGKMRITRKVSQVVFSVAEGANIEFGEFYRFDLGTEDITTLQMNANPSNGLNAVDLRVIDLRIRADKLIKIVEPVLSNPLWPKVLILGVLAALIFMRRLWNQRQNGPDSKSVVPKAR